MPPIRNIIFDFGNVLFDLDLPAIYREFKRYAGDQGESVHHKLRQNHIFELYETGGLSTAEFIESVRQAGSNSMSAVQIQAAWNAIFIGMPRERFGMLLRLRQEYSVFLLSNINDMHAAWIDDYMHREHGINDFQFRYFDAVYYSHLIRLRKPDPEIYEYVLADAELDPAETVFIDDLAPNVEAARALGIHGVLKTPEMDIMTWMGAFTGSPSRIAHV